MKYFIKNIINLFFPLDLHLNIFQLENYRVVRFTKWLYCNFFLRESVNKTPLKITKKIRFLKLLIYIILALVTTLSLVNHYYILVLFLLITNPYILIILSILIIKPYEIINKKITIKRVSDRISKIKNLKVIGIAGSYGKTSVKEILFHIIKYRYNTIKTPLSYNTVFGIAKVVDFEIEDDCEFFLCEIGEYYRGDVEEISNMVNPHYGIITGINNQHLERLKNINNTKKTIFELYDYLVKYSRLISLNFRSDFVVDEYKSRFAYSNMISYSGETTDYIMTNANFSNEGSIFDLKIKDKVYKEIHTPLLGFAHLNNVLGAISVANNFCGIEINDIIDRLKDVPIIKHRFEQKNLSFGGLLIDNSYSSNTDSMLESIKTISKLNYKNKIIITPGIVELGKDTGSVHENLGFELDKVFNKIILVGKNIRTSSLSKNVDKSKILFIESSKEIWNVIEKIDKELIKETVILIENDLPDNY